MAVNMFLKLDGITGESTHKGHKDEIEILSFSWGVTHSAPAERGRGGRAGRAHPSDINFVMRSNTSSPKLFLACASGRHLKEGIFVIEKAGESPFGFYTLTLTDLFVSSFQASGGEDVPVDAFSLAFRTLRIKELAQGPKGDITGSAEAAFDFSRNHAI